MQSDRADSATSIAVKAGEWEMVTYLIFWLSRCSFNFLTGMAEAFPIRQSVSRFAASSGSFILSTPLHDYNHVQGGCAGKICLGQLADRTLAFADGFDVALRHRDSVPERGRDHRAAGSRSANLSADGDCR